MHIENDYRIRKSKGFIALNPGRGSIVFARSVPENAILKAELVNTKTGLVLERLQNVLSKDLYAYTEDAKKVVGYEDPTFISAEQNPFGSNDALICTQTFQHDGEFGTTEAGEPLATNLVYFDLKNKNNPHPILTPQLLGNANLGKSISMVKEGELFISDSQTLLLFEYVDAPSGNIDKKAAIGMVIIKDGQPKSPKSLFDPALFGFEHASTCGSPILINDQLTLFINARKNRQWNVYMLTIPELDNSKTWMIPTEPCLEVPKDLRLSYGNQLIVFGSGVSWDKGSKQLKLFYHVNDLSSRVAYFKV